MIDLQPFCSTEPTRPYLHKPWSRGEWTWATNGHIMVRLPRIADIPEDDLAPAAEKVFPDISAAEFKPLPPVKVPEVEAEECELCGGSGRKHACPDCQCECDECDGTGKDQTERVSIGLSGAIFAGRYVVLMQALPGIEIATTTTVDKPMLPFRFDGGHGVVMPRKWAAETHIDA